MHTSVPADSPHGPRITIKTGSNVDRLIVLRFFQKTMAPPAIYLRLMGRVYGTDMLRNQF